MKVRRQGFPRLLLVLVLTVTLLLGFAYLGPMNHFRALAQSGGVSDARYAHLARGVNLNNWFQYGSPLVVTSADVTLLKNAGFTCIRLPIAPDYILPEFASASTIATNLTNIDNAIDLFLNAGMAVTLDFHAASPYISYYLSTPSAAQELVSTWHMLASRYSNRNPDLLFFEIMNEPTNQFTQAQWDTEQLQVLAAIRQVAPQHTVLVAPVNWSGVDGLMQMTPYSDPNLIYVMHDYDPLTFTHQGATWVSPTSIASLRNVPYPSYLPALQTLINGTTDSGVLALLKDYQASDWNADHVNWDLQLAAAWAKKWGVRVVVNEFGAYKPYSPPDSRARWIYDMYSALTHYSLGWAMWDYESGFDLVVGASGSRAIDPNLAPALGIQPGTVSYPQRIGPPPAFTSLRSVQIGGAPIGNGSVLGLTVADLNADGLPDVIATPEYWPSLPALPVQVFINQGGGIMSPAPFSGPPPGVQFAVQAVPGKFDRSGRLGVFFPDQGLSVAGGSGAQSKLILPAANNAWQDASNNLPQQIAGAIGAAAGDVNGDGIDDLVVLYNGPGSSRLPMQILRNDGTGRFQVDPQALPSWVPDLSRWDNAFTCGAFIPRPGQPINDLMAIGWNNTPGRVFRNDGSGRFSSSVNLPPPAASGLSAIPGGCAAVADLNGDGNPDLILGFQHANANQPDFVQILINNGDGTFRDETNLRFPPLAPSQNGLMRITISKTNNGTSNVLLLGYNGELPRVFADRGDGVFRSTSGTSQFSAFSWVPGDFAGGDLNGDGLADLVFGEGGTGPTIQVMFGESSLPADGPAPPPVASPVLVITSTHTGDFTQGQLGAIYTITVSDQIGAASTTGTVTVTEMTPPGTTLQLMSGSGWNCSGATCMRSDALPGGASYPPITVSVNVGSGTGSPVVNQVKVSGGGSAPYSNSDLTTIDHQQQSTLSLSSHSLRFGYSGQEVTDAQSITLSLTPPANLSWTASSNQSNITVTPSSGSGSAILQITAAPGVSGTITVTAPGATNSPQQIQVNVSNVAPAPPFGSFDTPVNNTGGIAGAIPVTGWALDGMEVTGVGIYREPIGNEATQPNGLVYIGNATLVAGSRPDVEAAYPSAPMNYRAGWGYMLLTNFLLNASGSGPLGNGTYKLHAIVTNKAGMTLDLGTRTITVDNAHATKPFGTIDTPAQGVTVSGNAYVNFGWALTQNPYSIPIDGSTLNVYVDGVPMGHPAYNQHRADLATLFPGLANSNGAVGFFYIDTTRLANGVHTIAWTVADSANRSDGIGSRYFTVANTGTGAVAAPAESIHAGSEIVTLRRGFDVNGRAEPVPRDRSGRYALQMESVDRIELQVEAASGCLLVNGERRPLPIGSTLKDGVFYWQAGPGFLGEYDLLFERPDARPVSVHIVIGPKTAIR